MVEWDDDGLEDTLGTIPWHSVDVADDDRTMTVRLHAEYDAVQITPAVSAELGPESVALLLRLDIVDDDEEEDGAWFASSFASTNESANRSVEFTLPEPLGGRAIVDAWKPPPPSPSVLRTVTIDRELGPITGHRRIILDSLDIYDDQAEVNYRLRPGISSDDDDARPLGWLWDLDAEDDVGTDYQSNSGAYGDDIAEVRGSRDMQPAPPESARRLTLIILDTPHRGPSREVGRVIVDLT